MYRFLGHGAAKRRSPSGGALGRGRAEQRTGEYGCGTQLFVRTSGAKRGSGLPVESVVGKRRNRMVLVGVSPVQSRLFLGHCFGANATPAAGLLFCFAGAPSGLRFPPTADPP
jgi:hypothetical protein